MKAMRFVLMLTILFFSLWSVCASASGPKILIEEKIFDFKEAVEGQRIEHAFHVRNQGNAHLEIKKVKPG